LPLSNARAFDWTRKKLLKSGRASGEELRAMVEFEPRRAALSPCARRILVTFP
jgi:hypothetical protein